MLQRGSTEEKKGDFNQRTTIKDYSTDHIIQAWSIIVVRPMVSNRNVRKIYSACVVDLSNVTTAFTAIVGQASSSLLYEHTRIV